MPFRLPNSEEITGTVILQEGDGEIIYSQDPIIFRLWTFQERLLSRRIIVFGAHELYWQCNGAHRQCGAFDGTGEYSRPSFVSRKRYFEAEELKYQWERVLSEYTRRDITHEEDKLVALAGIASRFAEAQGNKDVYLAGLWKSRICEQLLWYPSGDKTAGSSVYVAPSWSWASLKTSDGIHWGSLRLPRDDYAHGHLYVETIGCETTVKTTELPFGQVTSGRIRLRGPLRQALQLQSTLFREIERETLTGRTSFPSTSTRDREIEREVDVIRSWRRFLREFEVLWDVRSEGFHPNSIFCLRFKDKSGLILRRQQPGILRRVGLYHVDSKETADDYFASSNLTEVETI